VNETNGTKCVTVYVEESCVSFQQHLSNCIYKQRTIGPLSKLFKIN